MTREQFEGLIRAVMTYAGGYATGHGYLTNDQLVALLGAVPAVIAAIWSFKSKQPKPEVK